MVHVSVLLGRLLVMYACEHAIRRILGCAGGLSSHMQMILGGIVSS